jgi:predicted kinase
VILDASWTSAECRAQAAAAAEDAAADLVQLHCMAPVAVTTQRMETGPASQTRTPG